MLRTLSRWFSTAEVKRLGEELDALKGRFEDLGHKLEGADLKLERLSNKYRMRDARAVRGRNDTGLSEEEQAYVDELRARGDDELPRGRDLFG